MIIDSMQMIEWFSIECHKNKNKAFTMVNHKKQSNTMNQLIHIQLNPVNSNSQGKWKIVQISGVQLYNQHQAWKNACD